MQIQILDKDKKVLNLRLPTWLLTSKAVCTPVLKGVFKDSISKDSLDLISSAMVKLKHGYSGFELVSINSHDGSCVKIIL